VVVPAIDPDPRVDGRGLAQLRAAGIRVEVGCLDTTAVLDNLGYYYDRLGTPSLVTLKLALSQDGMVARAPGRRDAVTGEAARADVHALRALHDAVVVGSETVCVDAPRLDCRALDPGPEHCPVPVVLDARLRTPADNEWSRAGRAFVVVTAIDADDAAARALETAGGRVLRVRRGREGVDVAAAWDALAAMGLRRLLVEGGPRVARSVLATGRWDAAWIYRSACVFGPGGVAMSPASPDGAAVDTVDVGDDTRQRWLGPGARERLARVLGDA
jgi:diaminohydroxyphosphoribosylaminopyrimidine deaminase/5-amino-6-(5-phosphoribosylamino)uracil reductase